MRGEAAASSNAGVTSRIERFAYRAGIRAPEGPDGIVQSWDERFSAQPLGITNQEVPGGRDALLRSGAEPFAVAAATANGRPPRGVDVPGRPLALTPTVPRSGRTLEHRAFTEPISTGPNVVLELLEAPRPSDDAPPAPVGLVAGPRRILYQPLPQYPEWAERDHVQAAPEFHIAIGADGRVGRVRLAKTSGYTELDRIAKSAIRRWIYEPRPGQPEERLARVRFILRKDRG